MNQVYVSAVVESYTHLQHHTHTIGRAWGAQRVEGLGGDGLVTQIGAAHHVAARRGTSAAVMAVAVAAAACSLPAATLPGVGRRERIGLRPSLGSGCHLRARI